MPSRTVPSWYTVAPGTHKLSFCFLQHRSEGMGAHACNPVLQSSPYLPPHSPSLKLFVTVLTLSPPKTIQACSKLVHRYAQALATLNPRSPLRLVRTQYTSAPGHILLPVCTIWAIRVPAHRDFQHLVAVQACSVLVPQELSNTQTLTALDTAHVCLTLVLQLLPGAGKYKPPSSYPIQLSVTAATGT